MVKIPPEYIVAAALVGLHCTVITLPGRSAKYAASNVVTNLIRLEHLDQVSGPFAVLAGSSMTGRLSEEAAAESSGMKVVNLGMDGCAASDALAQIESRGLVPEIVIIEANSLTACLPSNSSTLSDAASGPGAEIRRRLPFLRFQERPADLIYSALRSRTIDAGGLNGSDLNLPQTTAGDQARQIPPELLAPMEAFVTVLSRFHVKGSRVMMVMLPDNNADRAGEYQAARWVQHRAGIPFLDLKSHYDASMGYTDSVHLNGESSRQIARLAGQWIQQQKASR